MDYSRAYVRQCFAQLTPDSRPLRMGTCPIMAAYRLPSCKAATTLDPILVREIDRYVKRTYGPAVTWEAMTAGEVVSVIDATEARQREFLSVASK